MMPGFPQIPPLSSAPCGGHTPSVIRYIKDWWPFPYTLLQPKLDANGNPILDAAGNPVEDPANPVNLTGSIMFAELYVPFSSAPLVTLGTSTDADTNLALGKFKIVVPGSQNGQPGITSGLKPDAGFGTEHLTRLAVIQTDSLGYTTTLTVQHIAVRAR